MDTSEPDESNINKNKSKEVMDVDSGIENMEVEDADRKEFETTEISRVSSSNDGCMEQVVNTIGRILCVSWNEPAEGTIFLSSNSILNNVKIQEPDYQDLISQSIMEVLCQFASGENPLQGVLCIATGCHDDSPSSPDPHNSVNTPPLPQNSNDQESVPKQSDGLYYLMNCYSRVALEERNHPKVYLHILIDSLVKTMNKKLWFFKLNFFNICEVQQ